MTRWLRSLLTRRRPQELREAELQRRMIMARIASEQANNREWKPLLFPLRQATVASLRASCGQKGVR